LEVLDVGFFDDFGHFRVKSVGLLRLLLRLLWGESVEKGEPSMVGWRKREMNREEICDRRQKVKICTPLPNTENYNCNWKCILHPYKKIIY